MDKKDLFINKVKGLLSEESIYDKGLVEIYKEIFHEDVSYDNAQRQLRGVRKFLQIYDDCCGEDIKIEEAIKEYDSKIDVSLNKDGSQTRNALLELSEEEIKTPPLLLKAHGYDSTKFELISAKNSMWNQRSTKDGLRTLYSSKITVKPKTEISIEEIEQIFNKMDRKYSNKKHQELYEFSEEKKDCLIINYFDVHFGKLAYKDETSNEYNYQIAKNRLIESTKKYIIKNKDKQFKQIIFCIGQDYFNAEATGFTIGGTKQDCDLKYSGMFEKGTETIIEIIDMLFEKFKCPIYIPLVQGNHSGYTEYYMAQYLKAWYRNEDYIIIDATPNPRKYLKFGNNLFGFSHNADEGKRLDGIMQVEVPQLWGETIERTWFTGHLHNENVTTGQGVFIRQAPTLCGTDVWHKKKGYVQNIYRTQSFIYNYNEGLTDIQYVKVL